MKTMSLCHLRIIKRPTKWNDKNILVGGVGSVATKSKYRGKGYATQLLWEAMKILKQEGVDIALLQTNISKGLKLYSSVGFLPAHKSYTFYDSSDQLHIVKEKDVMMAPVLNQELLNDILGSPDVLHIGKGDW